MNQRVLVNWKDLINAGAQVQFARETLHVEERITVTWAYVNFITENTDPTPLETTLYNYGEIKFRATHNCDVMLAAQIGTEKRALHFLADLGVRHHVERATH